eukprot:3371148-Prorocentrum_lima.AAC.1
MVQDQEGKCTIAYILCGIPLGNSIQWGLMKDPGEPLAMWDPAASHFLWPMTSLPRSATGTSRAL